MRSKKVFIVMCIFAVASSAALAVRGRPHVDTSLGYKVLLSDQNTLLRGVSLSWDGGDPYGSLPKVMPSLDSLIALREVYGLNTVHLFLEGDSDANTDPVGTNAADCDILVDRCAQAGLYLIITIGCNGQNGQIVDLQWCVDFWNFYAPRYANETHVIYEAKNEPVPWTCGHWTQEDWDKQVVLYNAMRPNAPDTYLLMFTFQGFNNASACINGINYLESQGVDWSYAGVAWHGYTALDAIEDVLVALKGSLAYPATLCTEFYAGDTEGQGYNSAFESHFTGWMQFMWLMANDDELPGFAWKIDQAGTIWTPEQAVCDWPSLGGSTSSTGSVGIYSRGVSAFVSENGDLTANLSTYTGGQNDNFIIEPVATSVESNMVALNCPSGLYASTTGESDALTAQSSSVGLNETFQLYDLPNGDTALRSVASGHLLQTTTGPLVPSGDNANTSATNYALVDGSTPTGPPADPVDPPAPDPGPFFGTPMAIPGLIELKNYDHGGEGVAYHDTEADNFGHFYRPYEGVDLQGCVEGGSNVAWADSDEWMDFTVDVASAGTYDIITRCAGGPMTLHIEFDGVDVTGPITTTETGGWQVWQSFQAQATLNAGVQVMRVYIDSGGSNMYTVYIAQGATYCGDGTCDPDEDADSCPIDCGGDYCGDGVCNGVESCVTCPGDCISKTTGSPSSRYCCGDGTCEGAEDSSNCATDCGGSSSYCGDGTCDPDEDQCNCSDDCGTPPSSETNCTDGDDEDCDGNTDCNDSDCASDPACQASYCGDGTCDPGEDQCNCSDDCGTPPATETDCSDGNDEDCDGNTDCDDIDCDGDPACPDCVANGEYCDANEDCCSNKCRRNTCR